MRRRIAALAALAAAALPSAAAAEPLSELELLGRCYGHLTGRPLPLDHRFRELVESGVSEAPQLCESLLEDTELGPGGVIDARANPESAFVMRQLHSFHRTWFDAVVFEQMQGYNGRHAIGTHDLFDSTEPALAVTWALFEPGARYRAIFESKRGWFARRSFDDALTSNNHVPGYTMPSRRLRGSGHYASAYISVKKDGVTFRRSKRDLSDIVPVPTHVEVGELIGIERDGRSFVLPNYSPQIEYTSVPSRRTVANGESALSYPGMIAPLDALENQGSGVLGLNSFILMNWGHEAGRRQDGALKMARRWPQAFFSSMLCRELPVVRQSDAAEWVASDEPILVPTPASALAEDPALPAAVEVSPVSFRTNQTCVSCHATTDQLAAAMRNHLISLSNADYSRFSGPDGLAPKTAHLIGRFEPARRESYRWPARANLDSDGRPIPERFDGYDWPAIPEVGPDGELAYHTGAPRGVLIYRSVTGELVREPIEGIEGVGPMIAERPDPYQCAAARYLSYFTGTAVELYDPGDPANFARAGAEDLQTKQLRRQIEAWGAEFQQNQSLRSLLGAIMRSPIYRDRNYMRAAPQGGAQ